MIVAYQSEFKRVMLIAIKRKPILVMLLHLSWLQLHNHP